jgi:hypothetical protein
VKAKVTLHQRKSSTCNPLRENPLGINPDALGRVAV